jgi:very-short-patch-repair endonuclease
MRRSSPATERFLWTLLRDRSLERLKFLRRVPLGRYVVDFVCMRHRLVVEATDHSTTLITTRCAMIG